MVMLIKKIKNILLFLSFFLTYTVSAQEKQDIHDFSKYDDYIIGGLTVSGVRFLDPNALIGLSGLRVGQEITVPGDELKLAVQKLWQQGLFSDVRISISRISLILFSSTSLFRKGQEFHL